MPSRINIRRLIRTLLLVSTVVALLCVAIILLARVVMKNNGISYERIAFRFPSSATVKGLRIEQTALSLRAGTVSAQWSWRALFQGNFSSEMIAISDAVVRIRPVASTGDTTASVPVIEIGRATLNNVQLIWGGGADSSTVLFRDVRATKFRFDGTLRVDSLVNRNSQFNGNFSSAHSDKVTDSTSHSTAASIQSIPEFKVGHFEFTDCDFDVQYDEHRYAVDQFNLEFEGLNNHDVMNMSLKRLSFRYQDSVNVDIALNDATVDQRNDAHIKNVLVELPGLRLSTPDILLSNDHGFATSAKFDSTFVDTDLLNAIFPTLKKWLPEKTRVFIDGGLSYHGSTVTLDHTTLRLGNDGELSGTGFFQFGAAGDTLDVAVHGFTSTLYRIAKWGQFAIPSGQKDLPIHAQMRLKGTYSQLHSDGQVNIQQTKLNYTANSKQRAGATMIDISLRSPFFEPRTIISSFSNDVRFAGLSLKGATTLSANKSQALHVELDADSLSTGGQWFATPHFVATYSPTHTVASVSAEHGSYAADVDIQGDAFTDKRLAGAGSAHFIVPSGDVAKPAGNVMFTRFHGTVDIQTPAANVTFDSLRFQPKDHPAYTGRGELNVKQLTDKSFKGTLSIDKYVALDALIGADFADWLSSDDKLARFPTATISMSLHADTTLMKALTGEPAYVEIEQLNITSNSEDIAVNFSSDTLYWQTFHTHQLEGEVRYRPGQLTAKIRLPEIITPYTIFDSVRFDVSTQRDSAYTISLQTYLPEIDRRLGVSYDLVSLRDGLRISFADSTLLLGVNRWRTDQSGSLFMSRAFDQFSGALQINSGSQVAVLSGTGKELLWRLEGLDLFPITQTITVDPPIHGFINASVSSNFSEGIYRWNGSLTRAAIDTVDFGELKFNGALTPDSLSLFAQLRSDDYGIVGKMNRSQSGPALFDIKVEDVDLKKFSSLLPVPSSTLTVDGILNANVSGSYGERLVINGYISFPNTEIFSSEYDAYLKSDKDSLVFNGTTATLNDFVFRDRRGNPITINGNVKLTDPAVDITIRSDRFRLLDRTQKKSTLTGEVDLSCDVRILGKDGDYKVSGKVATLDGATVTYLYKSTIVLDDRQREMEFVSFTEQEAAVKRAPVRRAKRKPMEWDVAIDVGKIDVTVLFSSVNQDHIKTTASGSVAFKTGNSAEPSAYGLIESNSGNIAYHVPMISDLRMTIAKAGVRWVGEVGKPLLSFNGSQTFRISPNEISSLWTNKTDRWPISVIAKVNDRPLNDLVLDFDISSTNNQVSDWITTLPADTREAYAVSLLLRGRINTGGTADVNLLTQTMVSKMNEISSRNIKSADVSFYDESRGPNSSEGSTSKIGYSISKGIINKKVRIVIGGSVDLTGQADPSMSDVKVEYVLREDPTITLRAGKANVYTGVIDGNVDESSFGFTYVKRFRNLFSKHKKTSGQ